MTAAAREVGEPAAHAEGVFIFRAREGCHLSQKDVDIIGPALVKLAHDLQVDLPQLRTKQVADALSKDPENPLWRYIDTSPEKAMVHWVGEQIRRLVQNIRYDRADFPELRSQALFEDVKDTSLMGGGGTGRAKVYVPDAYDKRGIATRIADGKIKRIEQAVRSLHDWTRSANVSNNYKEFAEKLAALVAGFDPKKPE